MRKFTLILLLFFFIMGISLYSCKKDNIPPVITLNGDDTMTVALKATFVDPGATATDENDGIVDVSVSGNVNTNSSGGYTLTYTARDKAGNSASKIRTVFVDAALYIAGYYAVTDIITLGDTTNYYDTISASTLINNKIQFSRFGNYDHAKVYATIAGTTISVPQQDVTCGPTGDISLRTFSGSGIYNATEVVIHYTIVKNDSIATATGTYIRQ